MTSNKYYRDPNDVSKQLRPGRFDPRVFDYTPNAGDGIPGHDYIYKKILGQLMLPRFVIEGCSWAGGTLSAGFIMYDGKVVVVASQSVAVASGEWLYIDSSGTGIATAVEATAKAEVMIIQDIGGTPYDVRFRQINNVLQIYGLNIQDNVDILGDLDVDGVTNLDNVDIDGTLDVLGVADFHDVIDMNSQKITSLAAGSATGDAVRYDEFNSHETSTANPHQVSLEQARTKSAILAGDVNMNSAGSVINLPAPASDNDAARKVDVDTVQTDLDNHEASTGASHTYIDQSVVSTASPDFANVTLDDDIIHDGDPDTLISLTTNAIEFKAGGVSIDINASGFRIATGARVTEIENNDALGTSDTKLSTQGNTKAYIDANVDQPVKQASSPTFVGLNLSADLVTSSTIDGVDVATLSTNYVAHAAAGNPHGIGLTDAFNNDKIIAEATSLANSFRVGSSTNYLRIHGDTEGIKLMSTTSVNDHFIIGTMDARMIIFETQQAGRWVVDEVGAFVPYIANTYDIGDTTFDVAYIYYCNLSDTSCADFSDKTIEELYGMFEQIKPRTDDIAHKTKDGTFKHVDFATIPDEFGHKAKENFTKENVVKMKTGIDPGVGKVSVNDIEMTTIDYNKGDVCGIEISTYTYALKELVVKLYEQNKTLEARILQLENP